MFYRESKRNFFLSIAVSFFLFSSFLFLVTLIGAGTVYSQTAEEAASLFVLKGNTKLISGKYAEGVDIELKKDGKSITKILSGKNGKYYLQMEISTTNPKNEYLLYISQVGTIPKTLSINTYISPEEYKMNAFVRYDFALEILMIETTVRDIVVERPSGKIRWDDAEHVFAFDQVYAKIYQKEDEKLKDDPDKYLRELAAKKKKEEDEIAKKKADEETKRMVDQKAKEEVDKILQQNLEAMKQELRKKRQADSLAAIEAEKAKVEVQKFVKPVSPEDVDQNAFDGTGAYSINSAKKSLNKSKEKMNKEKAKNLSAKYETNNTLTSLLNMVDEHDKRMKKQ